MAILNSPLDFTGKLGDMSAYKVAGSDKIILRKKGGANKKRIKLAPEFERTRQNYTEFSACTLLTAAIRDAIYPVKHLGDIRFTGLLNAFGKKIQLLDETGTRGERSVRLSQFRQRLTGFNINGNVLFDHVVRHPVAVEARRDEAMARVTIPSLVNDQNLYFPWKHAHYRLIVSLGLMGDVVFDRDSYRNTCNIAVERHYTEWRHIRQPAEPATVELKLNRTIAETATLLLAVGIEMGMPDEFNGFDPVKKAGAAKILMVF